MPYFTLTCLDAPNKLDVRMANRPDHLAYLEGFSDEIKVAGPLLDGIDGNPIGSHFIVEFPTQDAAKSFAAGDPYAQAGLFAQTIFNVYRVTVGGVGVS
jgi:uncharacterized protein YciI